MTAGEDRDAANGDLRRFASEPYPTERIPPTVGCVDCGAPIKSWRPHARCRTCARKARRTASREAGSLRELVRARNGRCVVCGLNPCGCEFGPKVDSEGGGRVESYRA